MSISSLSAVLDDIDASAGAVVMGTGIVSVGLRLDQARVIADVLLVVASLAAVVLLLVATRRARTRWAELLAGADSAAALTAVAAIAVLGSAAIQLHWTGVAATLLVIGIALCAGLMATVRAKRGSDGVVFMLVVAPQSLATLCAELAERTSAGWLLIPSASLAVLGIALYPSALSRFDLRALRSGQGAHWVAGGSLAISVLAVAQLAHGTRVLVTGGDLFLGLRITALVLWAVALVWLVVLVLAELRWPRWRYWGQRWATVFPLGMYAVCSFALHSAGGPSVASDFAQVWIWMAVAGWAATAVGLAVAIDRRVDFGVARSSHRRPFPSEED